MLVLVGGIIPDDDIAALEAAGVARVFTPGASLDEIGSWLEATLDARERLAPTEPIDRNRKVDVHGPV